MTSIPTSAGSRHRDLRRLFRGRGVRPVGLSRAPPTGRGAVRARLAPGRTRHGADAGPRDSDATRARDGAAARSIARQSQTRAADLDLHGGGWTLFRPGNPATGLMREYAARAEHGGDGRRLRPLARSQVPRGSRAGRGGGPVVARVGGEPWPRWRPHRHRRRLRRAPAYPWRRRSSCATPVTATS